MSKPKSINNLLKPEPPFHASNASLLKSASNPPLKKPLGTENKLSKNIASQRYDDGDKSNRLDHPLRYLWF